MLRPALLLLSVAAVCAAQEALPEQPAPFSVWLDFPSLSRPGAADPALPIWFEALQTHRKSAEGGEPPKTIYRLRLRRLPSLQREMLLRVFFDDVPEMHPVVRTWTETGKERFHSPPLGSGVGLPTSESVIIPLEGADYIDLEVPGNGSNVRGVHAASLKEVTVRQTLDFRVAPEVIAPFGNMAFAAPTTDDSKLYGRVQAALDPEPVRLSPAESPSSEYQFELVTQPLVAVVTFEVLNADLSAPPAVIVNEAAPVFVNIQWPDLADPGFRGEARGAEANLRFQYTGWLSGQIVIPGNVMRTGLNKITIALSEGSGPVAIRNVELQLKQNWKHFDYILTPTDR
jgi:hypothetical protein